MEDLKITTESLNNEVERSISIRYEDGTILEYASLKDKGNLDIARYQTDSDEPIEHVVLNTREAKYLKNFLNEL